MFKFSKMKKNISLLVVITMVITLFSFQSTKEVFANEEVKEIQIIGTSDLHGRFVPYEYAMNEPNTKGSLTQISTLIKELREKNPNTMVVDAGDTVQDNSAYLFLKDDIHPMILAMNEIGYDTWTLGNHEFNYGVPTLEKIMSQLKNTTILCGNVYKPNGEPLGKAYEIVEVNGVKIANIGMVSPHITKWDGPNLEGYKVTNPVEETKKAVKEIKDNKKADIIIATVHMGKDTEYGLGDSASEIAKECPEIAAIICGHAHSAIKGEVVNGVVITEPGKQGEFVSKIDIKLTKNSDGKYIIKNKSTDVKSDLIQVKNYKEDESLKAKLAPQHEKALKDANVIIGELKGGDLVPANEVKGITEAQLRDTPLLDLILEVQMFYGKKNVPDGARYVSAAAIFDSKANAKEGKIKKADTSKIYKYDNTLMTLKINGKQLKKYMEWSASYYNTFKEGDLTISFNENIRMYNYDMFGGIKYEINISKPEGSRIENLTYNDGTAVKDQDIIYLTVNNYRANTTLLNSESGLFKGENVEVVYDSANEQLSAVRDFIREYIVNEKNGVITPTVDNNWKLTGYNFDKAKRAAAVKLINEGKVTVPTSEDGRTPNVRSITWDDIKDLVTELPDDNEVEVVNPDNSQGTNNNNIDDNFNIEENEEKLPQTGSEFGNKDFIAVGSLTSLLGIAMFVFNKKKKDEEAA